LFAWITLPHGVRSNAGSAQWSVALRVMRHDKRLHKLLLAQFAIALVFLQMSSTFGLHVTNCGFTPRDYGLLISLNGVLIVFLELPLTNWTRRLPTRPTIAVGYLLIGLGFAATAGARTIPALVAVLIVFTIGEMIAMPIASAFIVEKVPPTMRGRYMGAFGLVWALGLTIGPSTGIRIHEHASLILWGSCGLLGIIAAAIVVSLGKDD
jgi:MFS family permease